MQKIQLLAALLLGASPLIARADTLTLKDGSVVEGTVLSETAESYVVEIQVTKSIKDERTIPKSEVAKVTREQPDHKAFEAISKLGSAPDFSTSEEYAARITAFEKFIAAFPESIKVYDAKKSIETLKSEATQIEAGGTKYNGLIISKEDYLANAYELDSLAQAGKIRAAIANNEVKSALRSFAEFDRDFAASEAHAALLPAITNLMRAYLAEATQSLSTLESRIKERKVGLDQMALADRKSTEAAVMEEDADFEKRYQSEKAAKVTWLTTSPFHLASLTETSQLATKELARLSVRPTIASAEGDRAYREVYTVIHSSADAPAKEAALAAAKTAGISARYLAPLEAIVKKKP